VLAGAAEQIDGFLAARSSPLGPMVGKGLQPASSVDIERTVAIEAIRQAHLRAPQQIDVAGDHRVGRVSASVAIKTSCT
jgi:hypothetical protein